MERRSVAVCDAQWSPPVRRVKRSQVDSLDSKSKSIIFRRSLAKHFLGCQRLDFGDANKRPRAKNLTQLDSATSLALSGNASFFSPECLAETKAESFEQKKSKWDLRSPNAKESSV